MDIIALDENFTPVEPMNLKYYDMVWNRKYYETGKYSVQIRASDYNEDMKYIFTKERQELGIVQKVAYSEDDEMIVLSGFFYEKKLADKVIYPTFERYGSRAEYVAMAVEKFKSDIPKLVIADFLNDGENVQKQETGATLEDVAHATLQVEEKSYRCIYDFENDVINFEIYQGVDRTQEQSENNFVTFSKGFRNIRGVKKQSDDSNYKNYFIIGGQGEGTDRITAFLDLSDGEYKKELFIDASNKRYDKDKQTLDEYKQVLMQVAVEKAKKYVEINNVEFDAVANSGAKYIEDYDLGDKCDIIIEKIGKSYTARIIEVLETWKNGEHKVTLTFGDKIPTQYEKARII